MKISSFIIIILIVITAVGLAQYPISFRSQALGGTVQDDLDLIYDPIQLRFVEGIQLYTNLSNLTSYSEELFNNNSDHEFLFGATIGNPFIKNLWTSALVRYQNSHMSNSINIDSDLDGFTDIYTTGNFKDIYNAYLDTDFNGLYDIRNEIIQEKTNFLLDKKNIFVLNNTYQLNQITFGFKASFGTYEGEGTTASSSLGSGTGLLTGSNSNDPSFSLNYKNYTIEDDFNNVIWKESGDYLSNYTEDFSSFDVAVMRPFKLLYVDTVELRADIGYTNEDILYEDKDLYAGSVEYFSPVLTVYDDIYSETENYNYQSERNGSMLTFHVQARKKFEKAKRRVDEGFWSVNFGYHTGSYDYTMSQTNGFHGNEYYFDGTDTLMSDYEDDIRNSYLISDKGDESYSNLHTSLRLNLPLSEDAIVGTGIALNYSTTERNTKYMESYTYLKDYEVIDTLLWNDYTTETTFKIAADRTYELTNYHVTIPVGVEYKFTESKNWSLRFGSIFEYYKTIINDKRQITASEPMKTVTQYADGSNPTVTFSDNESLSTSSHRKTAESLTTFVYGLGYQPTENLQIDLLGFLGTSSGIQIIDADFYRSLRLSISVKL